ncbi:MAG: YciI family protein [Acaryochloris sp. RU_4_1]|nr:YciI family protein [Acaryochloris sp. RU_4_1]NJR54022.1 YciI family protein [Acaryochloris sp. CRU_2_0]
MPKYVMWGSYCEGVLEKRTPYRQAHLEGLNRQKESGTLITLGPTQDLKRVFGIYEAKDKATIRHLVESDPYWQNGIWTDYEVHEWIQAI